MPSRTISLEVSAYDRLKAAKWPGESFSVTVNRILGGSVPTYRSLAGFLSGKEAQAVREAVRRMRGLEAPSERSHIQTLVGRHGRNARH